MDLNTFIELYNILPKNNIKDLFKNLSVSSKFLVNIFGNFDVFKENQQIEGNDLWKIINISSFNIDNKILSDYYIECKIGYIKYIKNWFKWYKVYCKKRNDLNLGTRLYISFIKTNRNIFRFKFYVDINTYIKNEEKYDNKLKELFDANQIDRIYIKKRSND